MDNKLCTKFCDVLVTFQKVIRLQSFEFSITDVIILDNDCCISQNVGRTKINLATSNNVNLKPSFFVYFCYFYGEKASYEILWCF